MDWLHSINKAIEYMEDNICEAISVEDVAIYVYSSYSNFARIFYLITGVTLSEYIRNRRLSLAGQELLTTDAKVVDIAAKYQYDTSESFSKAFSRFHGITPSDVKKNGALPEFFHPFSISISVQGGYSMARKLIDEFHWHADNVNASDNIGNQEKYDELIYWARKAREKNPNVFDKLIEWLLDDAEWGSDYLSQNQQILMQGVFARFREQNAHLRTSLLELRQSGLVNESVFKALDQFDEELIGLTYNADIKDTVSLMFRDFSVMQDRKIRQIIAGSASGPLGTDHIEFYGYINGLKDLDAQVQWSLFMPDTVERQQNGFSIESFEYVKAPAMRFIGKELEPDGIKGRQQVFSILDNMCDYNSQLTSDIMFSHHNGGSVDINPYVELWGRFMLPDTPVPDGFQYVDLVKENDGKFGTPYISQYAYAVFSGDTDAMHSSENYDVIGMYDVTRNIILGQGITIPYPHKYWTAEVFLNGFEKPGTAYMFSIDRDK